jgi:acetyl esterase/lipase
MMPVRYLYLLFLLFILHSISALADYSHNSVARHKVGEGAHAAWVFIPDEPRVTTAPVVIFMHGYRALDPYDYGGWIDHLVRRGNVVIFPVYEKGRRDDRQQLLAQAVAGIRNALDFLAERGVTVNKEQFAATGHSMGGSMSVMLAARGPDFGLPPIRAVMPVEPGHKGGQGFPNEVFAELGGEQMLLILEGDQDQFADSRMGHAMFTGSQRVPASQKAFVILLSDKYRQPPLVADHYAPLSPVPEYDLESSTRWQEKRKQFVKNVMDIRDGEVDALDTEAMWPLLDVLLETTFRGERDINKVLQDQRINRNLWKQVAP